MVILLKEARPWAFIAGAAIFFLVNCSTNPESPSINTFQRNSPLIGSWIEYDLTSQSYYNRTMTFYSDGTLLIQDDGLYGFGKSQGIWRTSNDTLQITYDPHNGQTKTTETMLYGFSNTYQYLYTLTHIYIHRYLRFDSPEVIKPIKNREYPSIIGPDDTIVSILDTVILHATAIDSGSRAIVKYLWSNDSGFSYDTMSENMISEIFGIRDTGLHVFAVKVIDNATKVSLPCYFEITIKPYRPSVQFQDTSFYLNDRMILHAMGMDANGTIKRYYWTLNSYTTQTDTTVADSLEWHFANFGTYNFLLTVEDDDGLKSEPASGTVNVVPHTYGTSQFEYGVSVLQSADRGFMIAGNCSPGGIIVKTDSTGRELWNKHYNGDELYFREMVAAANGGFAITGTGGKPNAVFLLLDGAGNEQISRAIPGSLFENGESLVRLYDDGFLICGSAWNSLDSRDTTKAVVHRLDKSGNLLWTKTYSQGIQTYGNRIILTSDGAAMVLGRAWVPYCVGFDPYRYCGVLGRSFLLKINLDGDVMWSKVLLNDSTDYEGNFEGQSITETPDKYFLIAGPNYDKGGCSVYKITGESMVSLFNTVGSRIVIQALPDNGFLFANTNEEDSYDSSSRLTTYLSITDASANSATPQYFSEGSVTGCCLASDGNIVMVGQTYKYGRGNGDIVLMKVDVKGKRIW